MDSDVKHLAILGSTGSIGRQTLEVVRAFPHRLKVVALAAGRNKALLAEQAREFKPKLVFLQGKESPLADEDWDYTFLPMHEMVTHPQVDVVVVATAGKAGLLPTMSALHAGKRVALANKEVLVMAGELIIQEAKRHGGLLLPVDSEHSAIWQCLPEEGDPSTICRILLTASGGPFWHLSAEEVEKVTVAEALSHPTWRMGRKVTVDSATLMNKGMEVIEAHWLFHVSYSQIQVVIHRESIVHSMVEFIDGSIKAQISPPDMRLPIQYALSYPQRWSNDQLPHLDLSSGISLTFQGVERGRFPCLDLALEVAKRGGTYPAVLSAADEVAVELFLAGEMGFGDIHRRVESVVERHQGVSHPSLEEILAADAWAREVARGGL
ncbi:MAG: 1-deoxy-D-xylulose-5-phosphate reductoisomerase [Chloroflexi bacterium]|nr:1-deoxy-D-xylulose-5-phosphate reductoisomerase [Chloroflexota bacterium]